MIPSFWDIIPAAVRRVAGSVFLIVFASAAALPSASAQSCAIITPVNPTVAWAARAVGTQSLQVNIGITNGCKTPLQVNSFTLSPAGGSFVLISGWAPVTLNHNITMTYQIRFLPQAIGNFTGTFTLNVQGYSPFVWNLSGTGQAPGSAASWSTSSLNFSNVPVGTTSAPQTVTLTNSGTEAITITSVTVDAPFSVSGFANTNTVLGVKKSLPLKITFDPLYTGSYNDTLVVLSNRLPPTGVSLTATAAAPVSFGINSFPTLPKATQGAPYMANLQSAGGVGNVTWTLNNGSNLPSGLSLSSSGAITGTVSSSVTAANYAFTLTATDSNTPPDVVSQQFIMGVGTPPGGQCQDDQWNVSGTDTPMIPLTELGTGTYFGTEGGLFGNGSNVPPSSYLQDGLNFADAIQPLDANGNPDASGKIGLMSIGMSISATNFQFFTQDATADPTTNPHVALVPGAQPRVTADLWIEPTFGAWNDIFTYFLPQSGVTANQVEVAWVEDVLGGPSGTFPADMTQLQSDLESLAQLLHQNFPNLVIALYSPREYAGYAGTAPGDPEPYSYESAFAVRGMILDQVSGDPAMNYNPANGPVMAPWVGWGPYLWTNGLIARNDGLVWDCQDYQADGLHPSQTSGGSEKNGHQLLEFFQTSDLTTPWFLAQPGAKQSTSAKSGKN